MFHEWDSFYLLIGSAAAALIGLLFVVVTLTANLEERRAMLGAKIFMSPTVFHLAVVVVLSAVALTPHMTGWAAAAITTVTGAIGCPYATLNGLRIHRHEVPDPSHWTDVWFYGWLPTALYVALVISAAAMWTAPDIGAYVFGVLLVALLLLAIRNAWDLVTYLAPRHDK